MVKLKQLKTCSCGKTFVEAPDAVKIQLSGDDLAGLYWNCSCTSTLFVPISGADAVSLLKHQAGFRAEESESCGHDNLDDEGGCVECKASRDELRAEFDADMVCDMDQAEQDSA